MQGGDKKTVIGRICFHCENPVAEEARFCENCGGDLDLKKWMAENAGGEATLPPANVPPKNNDRLSQIPAEQLLKSRPELTLSPAESICFSQDASLAVIVGAQGCYAIHLQEMRAEILLAEACAGRRAACSPDGTRVLLVDLPNTILYFIDLKPGALPEIRAFQYPELADSQGDLSAAVFMQAAVSTAGGALFLFEWDSGALVENIPLPADDTARRLSYTLDGGLLCGLSTQTFFFDTAGGTHEIPGIKVALNAQNTKLAGLMYNESTGQYALQAGDVQSLAPFSWSPSAIQKEDVTDVAFSSDGSRLLLQTNTKDGVSLELVSAQDGASLGVVQEPLYPGVGFALIDSFAASSDAVYAFALGHAAYDSSERLPALFCYSVSPVNYNGAVSLAFRAPNTPFAAPPEDPDTILPIGETKTGYFGRLDQTLALGADWSSSFEYPELVTRALLGEDERSLLEGVALLARDDYEERLRFWFSLGAMIGVRSLVDASLGLTPFLSVIVKLAGGESSSNDQLLVTCQAVSKYTPEQRERLLRGESEAASADGMSAADTLPPESQPEQAATSLPLPKSLQGLKPKASPTPTPALQAAPKPAFIPTAKPHSAPPGPQSPAPALHAAPKPAPRPAPGPGGPPQRTAQPTMVANAADVAALMAGLPPDKAAETLSEEEKQLKPAPKPAPKPGMQAAPKPAARPAPAPPGGAGAKRTAQATMMANADEVAAALAAPDPAAKVPVIVAGPNASNVGSPAPFSGTAPAPFSGTAPAPFSNAAPTPFSNAAPQQADPKEQEKSAIKKSLGGLKIAEDAALALLALPLCEVVWADGDSAAKESDMVADFIAKNITLKSAPSAALASQWLKACPTPDFCEMGRSILRDMVKAGYHPATTKDALKEIQRLANEIAGAAGGFLGINKVSKEEKQILSKIEASFKIE